MCNVYAVYIYVYPYKRIDDQKQYDIFFPRLSAKNLAGVETNIYINVHNAHCIYIYTQVATKEIVGIVTCACIHAYIFVVRFPAIIYT